jgi:hypothetical protein
MPVTTDPMLLSAAMDAETADRLNDEYCKNAKHFSTSPFMKLGHKNYPISRQLLFTNEAINE